MLTVLLCAAMMFAWLCPQTPLGRMLRRLLVEWPARKLAALDPRKMLPKLTAGRVLLLLLVLSALALVVAVARADVTMFLAQGMPEGIAWFATFDVAAYLDVIALALVLGATVRVRAIYAALKAWVARSAICRRMWRGRSARSRSPRPERRPHPPSNDDEPGWRDVRLALGW